MREDVEHLARTCSETGHNHVMSTEVPRVLRYLIDRLHQAVFGVIMDWVPGHFPKDEWALGRFDGTPLYEHADPRRGEHPDWDEYRAAMVTQGKCLLRVTPQRWGPVATGGFPARLAD